MEGGWMGRPQPWRLTGYVTSKAALFAGNGLQLRVWQHLPSFQNMFEAHVNFIGQLAGATIIMFNIKLGLDSCSLAAWSMTEQGSSCRLYPVHRVRRTWDKTHRLVRKRVENRNLLLDMRERDLKRITPLQAWGHLYAV